MVSINGAHTLSRTSPRSKYVGRYWIIKLGLMLWLQLMSSVSLAALQDNSGYIANYESAVTEYNKREYMRALIHAKNALSEKPDHLPSRLLLGNIHIRLGEAPAAEKELMIALRLGADKEQVTVPLGNALLLQRKYQEILDTIDTAGISTSGKYEVYTLRGRALLEMGRLEEAHASFDQAIAFHPGQMEAYLGKSRTFSAQGDYTQARTYTDLARDRAPNSPEVLYETAKLKQRAGDRQGALALYSRALELAPSQMRSRLARSALNLELGHYEQAREDAEIVHEAAPGDPDAAFLYARALIRLERSEEAKAALQVTSDTLARISEMEILRQPSLLRFSALLALMQDSPQKANFYLDRYVSLLPHEIEMRKISARVKLQLDYARAAIDILYPAYRDNSGDAELLFLLGQAYLQTHRYGEAQIVLERAAELAPDSVALKTRLGFSKIGSGKGESAWEDFSDAFKTPSAESATAGIVLTIIQIRQSDYDSALTTATTLLKRQPDNPFLHNLAGIVYLGRSETAQARAAFNAAVALDKNFVPALYNLGLIDQSAGRIDAAHARFTQILAIKPQQTNALLALAKIEISRGNYANATDWLEKATAVSVDQIEPHIDLIELYLFLGDVPAAQREAQLLANRHPENALVKELEGTVELAAGNTEAAARLFRRAIVYVDSDGKAMLRIADHLIALKDYDAATTLLVKTLDTDERLAANHRLVDLYLIQGEVAEAQVHADELLKDQPDSSIGYVLQAKIHARTKRYDDALAAYQAAFKLQPSRDILLEHYKLLFALGRKDDGFNALSSWLADYPTDTIVERNLALGYLEDGQIDKARELLESLAVKRPDDSLILASLAQLYQRDKNPQARQLAARAVKISPDWSITLDTYGWILVTEGEAKEGLKYLRESITRDKNPLTRYHIAVALRDLDRESEALLELEAILRLRDKPPWIESARELYEMLRAES